MTQTFTVYGDLRSGNCLKIKYVADYLGLPYEWEEIDIMAGESRTPWFLGLNPAGQVPVAQFEEGRLTQSNAIIRYIARDTSLLPNDAFTQARIDSWLFWEQYSHEPYVAVARFQAVYLGKQTAEIEKRIVDRANAALDVMEGHLATEQFFVANDLSVADVALLAYTRVAHEAGLSLDKRVRTKAWVSRCEDALGIEPDLARGW